MVSMVNRRLKSPLPLRRLPPLIIEQRMPPVLLTMLWGKLCFLAPFALATTASGGSLGVIRSDADWSARLEACIEEACAVGIAEGAMVDPEPIFAALAGAPDSFRSSMQKDVAAGWILEFDAIAGPSFVAAVSTESMCPLLVLSWITSQELYKRQSCGLPEGTRVSQYCAARTEVLMWTAKSGSPSHEKPDKPDIEEGKPHR
jgi:hypothetical protein